MTTQKRPRASGQLTAVAGELFVAAELLRRGIQCSVTFGNAKAVDLLAHRLSSGTHYAIQVKALKKRTYFPIKRTSVEGDCIYVFVILNEPGSSVEYFVVPGNDLTEKADRFGKDYFVPHPTFPGISPKYLEPYRNNWKVFES